MTVSSRWMRGARVPVAIALAITTLASLDPLSAETPANSTSGGNVGTVGVAPGLSFSQTTLGGPEPQGGVTTALGCDGHTGDRRSPAAGTQVGTIYTPAQDTFAISSFAYFNQQGRLQVRRRFLGATPIDEYLVEAHVAGPATDNPYLTQVDNATHPGDLNLFRDFAPYVKDKALGRQAWQRTFALPTGSPADVPFELLCYADHPTPDWGYLRAWIPLPPRASDGSGPGDLATWFREGFQVRVESTGATPRQLNGRITGANCPSVLDPNHELLSRCFFGADDHTVHLLIGSPAGTDQSPAPNVGIKVGKLQLFADEPRTAGAFLEATIEDQIHELLESLPGLLGEAPGISWSSRGYEPTVKLSVIDDFHNSDPNAYPAYRWWEGLDDEGVLRIQVDVRGWTLEQNVADPGDCHTRLDVHGTVVGYLRLSLARGPDGARKLIPDLGVDLDGLHKDVSACWQAEVLLGLVDAFYSLVDRKLENLVQSALNGLVDDFLDDLNPEGIFADLPPDVTKAPSGVAAPGVELHSWQPTCTRMGCDSWAATLQWPNAGGSELVTPDGIEFAASLRVNDQHGTPPTATPRRFPMYPLVPGNGQAAGLVESTATSNGTPFGAKIAISGALINDLLRMLVDGFPPNGGLLDTQFPIPNDTAHVWPEVAPLMSSNPEGVGQINSDIDTAVTLPDLRVAGGGNIFAIDVNFGISLSADPDSARLVPAIRLRGQVSTLRCDVGGTGLNMRVCSNQTSGQNVIYQRLINDVLPPIINNSIGSIKLPEVVGLDLAESFADAGTEADHLVVRLLPQGPTPSHPRT